MKPLLGLAALPLVVALLTSCSADDSDDKTATDPQAAPVTVTAEQACPPQLSEASDTHGFGGDEVATRRPEFGETAAVWACTYGTVDIGETASGGLKYGWERVGEPTKLGGPTYDVVAAGLTELKPAPSDQACTADLGPRVMLSHVATDGRVTGVVIDLFGCRNVRLTPDPAAVAPGESGEGGVPAGVFAGSAGLINAAQGLSAYNE